MSKNKQIDKLKSEVRDNKRTLSIFKELLKSYKDELIILRRQKIFKDHMYEKIQDHKREAIERTLNDLLEYKKPDNNSSGLSKLVLEKYLASLFMVQSQKE